MKKRPANIALGAELADFWAQIPEDIYADDMEEYAFKLTDSEGPPPFDPLVEYDLDDFGSLYRHEDCECVSTFKAAFRRWLPTRGAVTRIVFVPSEQAEEFDELVKAKGWRTQA